MFQAVLLHTVEKCSVADLDCQRRFMMRRLKTNPIHLLAICLGLALWSHPTNDPDLGWHLLGGEWISRHQALPDFDFINSFNSGWHDYHWLSQIVFYQLYRLGGFQLLKIFFALLMTIFCLVLVSLGSHAAPQRAWRPWQALLLLSAFYFLDLMAFVRPQMLSLLGVAITLRYLTNRPAKSELVVLFLLTAIITNIHVYWVLIPALWLLLRCLPRGWRSDAVRPVYAWGGFLLLCLAGAISPYGILIPHPGLADVFMNYALIWEYMEMPKVLLQKIGEFRTGLGLSGVAPWLLLALFAVGVRIFSTHRFRRDAEITMLALIGFGLAVYMTKYILLFLVLAMPYLTKHSAAAVRCLCPTLLHLDRPITNTLCLLGSLWAALLIYRGLNRNEREQLESIYPLTLCASLPQLELHPTPPRDHIRVLTHFDYGGWCRWAAYQTDSSYDLRVTTDNRTQQVPESHYEKAFDLFVARRNWLQTLREWQVDVAVVNKSYPIAQFMALSSAQWRMINQDDNFAIFVPVAAAPNS